MLLGRLSSYPDAHLYRIRAEPVHGRRPDRWLASSMIWLTSPPSCAQAFAQTAASPLWFRHSSIEEER
jgi:hypothetical protein